MQCQNAHVIFNETDLSSELIYLDHDTSWVSLDKSGKVAILGDDEELTEHIHLGHGCAYPLSIAQKLLATLPPTPVQKLYNISKRRLLSEDLSEEMNRLLIAMKVEKNISRLIDRISPQMYKIMDGQVMDLAEHLISCIHKHGLHRAVCTST